MFYYQINKYKNIKINDRNMDFRIKAYKKFSKKSYKLFLLSGDVGGTNTRLGIFGIRSGKPELLVLFHFKSRQLGSIDEALSKAIKYSRLKYKIDITEASIAAAGPLSADRTEVHITNSGLNIRRQEILKRTKLRKIMLLNDFEAVGYGINMLGKKDIKTIKNAKKVAKAPVVLIGAGTGLGKTSLIYDNNSSSYIPIPSEAGHMDFPAENQFEIRLVEYIKKGNRLKGFASFEHLLSGNGIASIYSFLLDSNKSKGKAHSMIMESGNSPELISSFRKSDNICKSTFDIFSGIYAKFARNCAIDSLPFGGVYISGKIAVENKDMFNKKFIKIFQNNYKLANILKKMPIYLILDENVGLLGAAYAYCIKEKKSF